MNLIYLVLGFFMLPVVAVIAMYLLNFWFYPSKGMVIMQYLNNVIKPIRVKEMIGEGQKLIDIKFGPFWPLGAKYFMPPPDKSSRCITTGGNQFYKFASPRPGEFHYLNFDGDDNSYEVTYANNNAWTIHLAKVRQVKKLLQGDSALRKHIVIFTMTFIIMMTLILLTWRTNSIQLRYEDIVLGGR